MWKKLRYRRVALCLFVLLGLFIIGIYMFFQRNHEYVYQGAVQTYTAIYHQDEKTYTFDLKGFVQADKSYLSLNDIYNVMLVIEPQTQVYLETSKHLMTYHINQKNYYFDYGQDTIKYDDQCIDVGKYGEHIYISHKNVYISVYFIEKILFKNEKKIKLENKNAIIL